MKSMLEKLTENYEQSVRWGDLGHAVGFYAEDPSETIKKVYRFDKGTFTLAIHNGRYYEWQYKGQL